MKDFEKGEQVIISQILENWFDDGSAMEFMVPGVIVEVVANIGAKCTTSFLGEETERFYHWANIKKMKK